MISYWHWILFFILIVGMFVIDLGLINRRPLTIRQSLIWSCTWVGLAFAFAGYIYWEQGYTQAINFITGYVVEKSLSLDNLLVFIVIFNTFRLTIKEQHQVLMWGVIGAIVLRGVFITLGTALLSRFDWIYYLFGVFLLFTAVKMAMRKDRETDYTKSPFYRFCKKFLPLSSSQPGQGFFVYQHGKYMVTPLFLALLAIEFSDIIFAIDSIPAIFAITLDPFIVYTSNIFAILGLRSFYFLLIQTTKKFRYLSYGLSYILGFTSIKMLTHNYIEISNLYFLLIVVVIISISIFKSVNKD